MAEIIDMPGPTRLDIPANRVLENALKEGMTEAVVIGFGKDNNFYFASSVADAGSVLYHLEMAKRRLMEACEAEE